MSLAIFVPQGRQRSQTRRVRNLQCGANFVAAIFATRGRELSAGSGRRSFENHLSRPAARTGLCPMPAGSGFAFGPFRLGPRSKRLLRDDAEVRLASRQFDLLHALVRHPGELLAKDRLIQAAWPDVAVTDNRLMERRRRCWSWKLPLARTALSGRRGTKPSNDDIFSDLDDHQVLADLERSCVCLAGRHQHILVSGGRHADVRIDGEFLHDERTVPVDQRGPPARLPVASCSRRRRYHPFRARSLVTCAT